MKCMLLLAAVIASAWLAVDALAQNQPQPAKPDLGKAQTIVDQVCVACHAKDGNSPSPTNPNIAGMPAQYITLQLMHFKSGLRVNPVMQGMAAPLTDDDMQLLG